MQKRIKRFVAVIITAAGVLSSASIAKQKT